MLLSPALTPPASRHQGHSARTPVNVGVGSCSVQTPNSSLALRCTVRKVARTPSKQRETTELFDSLLESFILDLQDHGPLGESSAHDRPLSSLPEPSRSACRPSTGDKGCTHSFHDLERTVGSQKFDDSMFSHSLPIKLEDLLSDSDSNYESKDKGPSVDDSPEEKSDSETKHGLLLAAACRHRDQNLRQKGMMALALNVMETRRLKFQAQNHFQTTLMIKYFSKMKTIKNCRKRQRRLAIQRAILTEHNTKARRFHRKKLLDRSFLRWRAWYLYRRECHAYASQKILKNKIRIVFSHWWNFIRCKKQMMHAFQSWRSYIYVKNLKKLCAACLQQKQTKLLQESFNKWVFEAAMIAGERLLSSKLHVIWQESTCQRALRCWLGCTKDSKACRRLAQLQTSHWFNKWRRQRLCLEQMKCADVHFNVWQLKKAIAKWKDALKRSNDDRCLQIKQRCFTIWRRTAQTKLSMEAAMVERFVSDSVQMQLRRHFFHWRDVSERRRVAWVAVIDKVKEVLRKRRATESFVTWRRQLQCRRMLRHHLIESDCHLNNVCFSMWRKLTSSTLDSASQLFITKLHSYGDMCSSCTESTSELQIEASSSSCCESTNNSSIARSTPSLNLAAADCRLSHLQDLSCKITESLQSSTSIGENSKKRVGVVRRLFVENEHQPASEHSSVIHSSSQSAASTQLCSCLEPQVAQTIQEFQERMAGYSRARLNTLYLSSGNEMTRNSACSWEICSSTHNRECPQMRPHSRDPSQFDDSGNLSSPLVEQTGIIRNMTIAPSAVRLVHTATRCIKNMRLYPCNQAFYKWLDIAQRKASLRQRLSYVDNLFRLRKIQKCFEVWREMSTRTVSLKPLEKQHRYLASLKVRRSCICLWRERTQRNRCCYLAIQRDERVRCIRKAFSKWKERIDWISKEKSAAEKCRNIILKSTLKMWTDKLCQRLLTKRALYQWKFFAKVRVQEKQAQILQRYWCLSRVWTKWRQEYIREVMSLSAVRQWQHILLYQVFMAWQLWTRTEKP